MKSRLLLIGLLIGFLVFLFKQEPATPSASDPVPRKSPETKNRAVSKSDRTNEKILEEIVKQKNVPIEFYGQVVDQNGEAIQGVKIFVTVRHWYPIPAALFPDSYSIPVHAVSDSNGRFQINGAKGDGFWVESISKEGYRLSPKTYRHSGPVNGTPENPVVYKMWKGTGAPEHLTTYAKSTRIPYDGRVVVFDLLEGIKSDAANATGDIRVSLVRDPLERELGSKERYDWKATIEAIDGGLIPSDDEFLYLAPLDGYEPSHEIEMLRTDQKWTPIREVSFFLKSRGGQSYGRVTVKFMTDSSRETTGFSIASALNPAGSRNLEGK